VVGRKKPHRNIHRIVNEGAGKMHECLLDIITRHTTSLKKETIRLSFQCYDLVVEYNVMSVVIYHVCFQFIIKMY
jgi:hypothetical protein